MDYSRVPTSFYVRHWTCVAREGCKRRPPWSLFQGKGVSAVKKYNTHECFKMFNDLIFVDKNKN